MRPLRGKRGSSWWHCWLLFVAVQVRVSGGTFVPRRPLASFDPPWWWRQDLCIGTVHEGMRGHEMYVSFCLLEVLRGDHHCASRCSIVWRTRYMLFWWWVPPPLGDF